MVIKGKLHEVYPAKKLTDTFRKREFIIEYSENAQYPQFLKFELLQDNCEMIDNFSIGDELEISFDLSGKPWTNSEGEKVYFNSLRVWKILKINGGNTDNHPLDDFLQPGGEDLPF